MKGQDRTGRMFRGGEAQVSTKSGELSTIKFLLMGVKTVRMTQDPLTSPSMSPLVTLYENGPLYRVAGRRGVTECFV